MEMKFPSADRNKVVFPKFEYIDKNKTYPMMYSTQDVSKLTEHRIARIKTVKLRDRFHRLTGKNSFRIDHGYGGECIAKILETDRGAVGWGLFPGNFWDIDQSRDHLLLGKFVSEVFDPAIGVTDDSVIKFDFALHDLAGVIMGIPVYKMLGDSGVNPVPCYDTMILMDDISPDSAPRGIAQIAASCAQDYEMGYRDFKIKIGRAPQWMNEREGIKRDIEVVRLVRDRYPNAKITVDANDAYDPVSIKKFIDGVSDCNLFWIEEAFREDRENLQILRAYLDQKSPNTKIADGESRSDVAFLLSLAKEGLLDVLQMDIMFFGFTAYRQLLPYIKEAGAIASPHCWGFGIKTNYCCTLAAGDLSVSEIEGMIDETEGVDDSGYAMLDGYKTVPDAPGFGMKLIWGLELCENRLK